MPATHHPISLGSSSSTTVDLPGLRVSEIWFPPETLLDQHTHDRAVVAIVPDGAIRTRVAGQYLDSEPCTLWTEPAEEQHSNMVSAHGARVLAILPDPAGSDVYRTSGELLEAVHHWRHGGAASLARRMVAELRETDSAARLTLQGLALEVLGLGLRTRRPAGHLSPLPTWLRRARELLHDRFREPIEIDSLAREVGVSATRLARAYRAAFQIPLGTHQRRLRLDWAAQQLSRTDVSIGRVALRAGFSDQAHFTRHFRRHTGETPAQYRKVRR